MAVAAHRHVARRPPVLTRPPRPLCPLFFVVLLAHFLPRSRVAAAPQMAINEGSALRLRTDAAKLERDVFVYRAYIGVGNYAVVLDEIKDGARVPVELQAVKLLATYLSSPSSREVAVLTASQWLEDGGAPGSNAVVQLIAATIFYHESKFNEALRAIHGLTDLQQCVYTRVVPPVALCAHARHACVTPHVRCFLSRLCVCGCRVALTIQICLRISRIDVAQRHLKKMQGMDDESTLTQLCGAWINLALVRRRGVCRVPRAVAVLCCRLTLRTLGCCRVVTSTSRLGTRSRSSRTSTARQ